MTRESLVSSSERTSEAQSGGDWNALLAQYGQVMMRVGKLEEEARDLRDRLAELQGNEGG